MMKTRFRSIMTPPPSGVFFYETHGEKVSARTWVEMRPKVAALMIKHGVSGSPEDVVAAYMCPLIDQWYCTNSMPTTDTTASVAKRNAAPYFDKEVVTFDVISSRLQCCSKCPKHKRPFCLTCTGLLDWIMASFRGRRVRVPEDKISGTCECAKTFDAVVASVDYTRDDPLWEGAPDTCWRKQ